MSAQFQSNLSEIFPSDIDSNQAMLGLMACELLEMHKRLSDSSFKNNVTDEGAVALKQRLDEISYAVVMEYRQRLADDKTMKSLLSMLVNKISYFQNSFQETARLLMQEMRTMQEDVHAIAYSDHKKSQTVFEDKYKISNIDQLIADLKQAQANMKAESPHLFV